MWSTIGRARRRLDRGGTDTTPSAPETTAAQSPETPAPSPPRRVEDVVIVFGAAELDHLRVALEDALGDAVDRPDTPARIERALSLLLARRGLPGRPTVLRRPAGVSTPESWEIHLDGVEHAIGAAVRGAGRTGRFHA
jgi:hypothetical protein